MQVIQDVQAQVDQASRGFSLSLENVLQVGFNLFRKAPAEFMVFSILGFFVFSNPVSALLLGGPVTASYFHMAHLLSHGRRIELSDYFKGFDKFGELLKLNLLIFVVVFLGLLLLVVPGIYFAVSYTFAHFFVWFFDTEPKVAIRLSRSTVSGNLAQIFLLCLVLAGINFLGILALGVGILVSMPLSFCVAYAAFDDIVGISK
jgi:uncharacterized membrane protein